MTSQLMYVFTFWLLSFQELPVIVNLHGRVFQSQIVLLWRAASSNVNQGVAARLTAAVLVHHSERGEVELSVCSRSFSL